MDNMLTIDSNNILYKGIPHFLKICLIIIRLIKKRDRENPNK